MKKKVARLIGKVEGRIIKLSEGRSVFMGKSRVRPDANCIEFINRHGDVTRIIVSDDALQALHDLIRSPMAGEPKAYPVTEEEDEPEIVWTT